jgi:hypothetical protein
MNVYISRLLGAVAIVAVTLPTSAGANAPAGQYVVTAGGTGNGTVYDTKSKLTWQQTVSSTTYSWADAQSYCISGFGRLPTLKELQSLVDYSQLTGPMIDQNAFPSTPSIGLFWSATPLAGSPPFTSPEFAWYVEFGSGGMSYSFASYTNYVRCVR